MTKEPEVTEDTGRKEFPYSPVRHPDKFTWKEGDVEITTAEQRKKRKQRRLLRRIKTPAPSKEE